MIKEVIEDARVFGIKIVYFSIDFIDTDGFRKRDTRDKTMMIKDSDDRRFRKIS